MNRRSASPPRRSNFPILLLIFCALVPAINAQSAIFAVPNTDTQGKKTFYVEADFFGHFDKYKSGGFQSVGPSTLYGVTENVEIGLNYFFTRSGEGSSSELQPSIKWRFYDNKKADVAAAVGSVVLIPLKKDGDKPAAMFYANASKKFASANGMRLTGGIYTVANAEDDFGTRTGALLGFEQPLTEKLNLLVDWTSGKNRLGYSNAGFSYVPNKANYFAAGYTFGNSGRANNFLQVFYGRYILGT